MSLRQHFLDKLESSSRGGARGLGLCKFLAWPKLVRFRSIIQDSSSARCSTLGSAPRFTSSDAPSGELSMPSRIGKAKQCRLTLTKTAPTQRSICNHRYPTATKSTQQWSTAPTRRRDVSTHTSWLKNNSTWYWWSAISNHSTTLCRTSSSRSVVSRSSRPSPSTNSTWTPSARLWKQRWRLTRIALSSFSSIAKTHAARFKQTRPMPSSTCDFCSHRTRTWCSMRVCSMMRSDLDWTHAGKQTSPEKKSSSLAKRTLKDLWACSAISCLKWWILLSKTQLSSILTTKTGRMTILRRLRRAFSSIAPSWISRIHSQRICLARPETKFTRSPSRQTSILCRLRAAIHRLNNLSVRILLTS